MKIILDTSAAVHLALQSERAAKLMPQALGLAAWRAFADAGSQVAGNRIAD